MIYTLLKPRFISSLATLLRPWLGYTVLISFAAGLYGALSVPADYQQGDLFRILYVHVPASWGALFLYVAIAALSAFGLVTRMPQFFLMARSLAPIGLVYCLLSLTTGSLWGKPTWGAFWVWDARLTSMFILFLLYVGYVFMAKGHQFKALVPASMLSVIGVINIPIIKGSVEWWYTLHQPSSIKIFKTSAIHSSMAWPLWVMAFGFMLYAFYLASYRMVTLMKERDEAIL
jgi:heme exporter protein C